MWDLQQERREKKLKCEWDRVWGWKFNKKEGWMCICTVHLHCSFHILCKIHIEKGSTSKWIGRKFSYFFYYTYFVFFTQAQNTNDWKREKIKVFILTLIVLWDFCFVWNCLLNLKSIIIVYCRQIEKNIRDRKKIFNWKIFT